MSLTIKVDPESIKKLTGKARLIPKDQINVIIEKLETLEDTVSTWEGNGKSAYDEIHDQLIKSLVSTQKFMNAMLIALDNTIEDFSYLDKNLSKRFEQIVDNYNTSE